MAALIHRTSIATVIFLSVLFTGAASANVDKRIDVNGYLKGYVHQQSGSPRQGDRFGSRLKLSTQGEISKNASYFVAAKFELQRQYGNEAWETQTDSDSDELYIDLSTDWDLRLGQQYIFWGRTTWVNPTDRFTAWDYARMSGETEDYRIAPVALRAQRYFSNERTLDMVWLPVFRPSKLGANAPQQINGLPVEEQARARPDRKLKNGEFGLQFSQSISSRALDWSLSAYRGFNKRPTFRLTPVFGSLTTSPVKINWLPVYEHVTMMGADMARAFGAFVLKGEIAFTHGEDANGDDPLSRNNRIETVLGLNHAYSHNLDLGVQIIARHLQNYNKARETAALTMMRGSPPKFVASKTAVETSLSINYKLTPAMGGQLIAIYNTTYEDYFALGVAWWEVAEALKLYIGSISFGGEQAGTPFARQKDHSRLFVEMKYSF